MDQTHDYISGLERSRLWWMLDVSPALETNVADLYPYIAAGLVGEGSDAFGYDDEISTDHDAQTRLCVWIPAGVGGEGAAMRIRGALAAWNTPDVDVQSTPLSDDLSTPTIQVHQIVPFYRRYTGLDVSPRSWREWLAIPPHNLAAATNGEVFYDGPGRFTQRRSELLAFYPEQVRLKLLEGACLHMGQAGQYNYPRLMRRGEFVAAQWARALFVKNALAAVFLLNRAYMPYYKWAHHAVRALPILGEDIWQMMNDLVSSQDAFIDIEKISAAIICEIRRQALSASTADFLVAHAQELRSRILESDLRKENPWKL